MNTLDSLLLADQYVSLALDNTGPADVLNPACTDELTARLNALANLAEDVEELQHRCLYAAEQNRRSQL